MKKIILAGIILVSGSMSFAQTEVSTTTNTEQSDSDLLTSLKPEDGKPVVFNSIEELNAKKNYKMDNMKQLILDNRDNPELVKYYREELWRFENAIVVENK